MVREISGTLGYGYVRSDCLSPAHFRNSAAHSLLDFSACILYLLRSAVVVQRGGMGRLFGFACSSTT